MQITDIFRAKIVDVQPKKLTIEITGNESKVEKFIGLMQSFGILDLSRTGKVALERASGVNTEWLKATASVKRVPA